MRIALLALICAGIVSLSAQPEKADPLPDHLFILQNLQKLSQQKRYGDILDCMSADYRNAVSREHWIKQSESLGWVMTKARLGTFTVNGNFADASVRCDTVIGTRVIHIEAVAYFVREGGAWKFWNFPFVPMEIPDRLSWPPPFTQP
ncbi:MAG: hypothetical protein HZA32_21205 [Opitutae bacterium]|nr:hypothetical protein [Opitutae bacterium]